MPNSRCGTVQIFGHSGDFTTEHYGAHTYSSPNVQQPLLVYVSGFDASGLNDSTFEAMRLDYSDQCYGGGIRFHTGAVFGYGLSINTSNSCSIDEIVLDGTYTYAAHVLNSVGLRIRGMTLGGTYANVVRWVGSTDYCFVDNVKPLTEPTAGFFIDGSTGFAHNYAMRAPGYDMKQVTTGTTIDGAGFREIRLNYASATTITNVTGLQQGQSVKLMSMNANAIIANQAGGAGTIELSGAANRSMGTRHNLVLAGHITGSGGSYTYRCVEVSPRGITLSQLTGDTTTPLTVGSLNIGHSSDTTITRLSAGRIGVENNMVAHVLSAIGVLDFGSVSGQSFADLTITVTGAALGDSVALGVPTEAITARIMFTAWVSAANTVTVRAHNYSAAAADPASGTFKATIVR